MDGESGRPASPDACCAHVAEALHLLECEAPAHAEMNRIRTTHRQGAASAADRRRYGLLWLAVALRRSPCVRNRLSPDVRAAVLRWQDEYDALREALAGAEVDAAFDRGDDTSVPDTGSRLPR